MTIGREEFRKAEWEHLIHTEVKEANSVIKTIHGKSPLRAAIAATYINEMSKALDEMARILKPGGHAILVSSGGTISGERFHTNRHLEALAIKKGFSAELRLKDAIRSRGLMTKRNSTAGVMTTEHVTVLRKG